MAGQTQRRLPGLNTGCRHLHHDAGLLVTAERFAADVGGGRNRPASRFTGLVGGGFTELAALDAPLNPVRQQAQGHVRVVFPGSIANKVRSHLNAMGRAPVERPFARMLMRAPLVDERSSILGIRNIIVLLGIPGQERIPLAGEVQREGICFVGVGSLDKLTCARWPAVARAGPGGGPPRAQHGLRPSRPRSLFSTPTTSLPRPISRISKTP